METKTTAVWLLGAQSSLSDWATKTGTEFRNWMAGLVADEEVTDIDFITAVNLCLALKGGNAINLAQPSNISVDSLMKWQKGIEMPPSDMRRALLSLLLVSLGQDNFTIEQMVRMVESQKMATIIVQPTVITSGPSAPAPQPVFDPEQRLEDFPGFEELGLRIIRALKEARIERRGQLLVMTERDLRSVSGIGKTSSNAIRELLKSEGLNLGMTPEMHPQLEGIRAELIASKIIRG